MLITRRTFLHLGTFTLCVGVGLPRIALAFAPTEKRFLFIFLRGGMDGLFSVPPHGDPDFARARTDLATPKPGQPDGALRLNDLFGLHPALPSFYQLYQQQQLAVFHAVASPYRERSHFDAQNLLENGTDKPHLRESGWLNAALLSLQAPKKTRAIAIGTSIPLSLIGNASVTSWAPSKLPRARGGLAERLQKLYAADPQLKEALTSAQSTQVEMNEVHKDRREQMAADGDSEGGKRLRQAFAVYMRAAGKFLSDADGPRIATVDLSGFDSHAGQANANGQPTQSLKLLDTGLMAFKEQLGETWKQTAVLIVTEFGRTVAMNGSRGTDHGTATAAFLAGGAVKGGRVIADWPGLSPAKLYQERDLQPTLDLRRVEMAVMRDHMGISEADLYKDIFPGSDAIGPLEGLFT